MVSCAVHPLGITEISPRVDKLLKGGPTGSCRRTRQSSASGAADEMFALADFPVGIAVYEFNICPSGSPALAWTPPWVDGAPQSFSSADRQHHPLPRQESVYEAHRHSGSRHTRLAGFHNWRRPSHALASSRNLLHCAIAANSTTFSCVIRATIWARSF